MLIALSDPAGDKSEVLDIDAPDLKRFPDFVKARRYECVLEPGDLLFIPGKTTFTYPAYVPEAVPALRELLLILVSSALWFHNTLALQFGVGVNVFWRHLPADVYDKKDPYGNKDPVAAARALQALERALHALDELPAEHKDFYGRRMIQVIQRRTFLDDEDSDTTLPRSQFTNPG